MKLEGENIKVFIGEVLEEEEEGRELGPTPFPGVTTLRDWHYKLLKRYEPRYKPVNKNCSFCAFGPCDLSAGRKGACGIDIETQAAREALFTAITGAAAHSAHARHLLNHLIKEKGKTHPIDVAENTEVQTPITTLITGLRPKTIGELVKPMQYIEEQLNTLTSSLHMGQESSKLDFESKVLHAGMLDLLGMEIADVLQVSVYGFPKGDPESPLVDIGFSTIDKSKPVVLCIGHNVASGVEIVDYAKENDIDVEIAGLCCTSHDLARYDRKAKVIGPLSYQMPFVRSGIADVIVIDSQCIRLDNVEIAEALWIPVISTSDKNVAGYPDLSSEDPEEVAKELATRKVKGAYIPDTEKAGEVAVRTAIQVHKNKKIKVEGEGDIYCEAEKCTSCNLCTQACPVGLPVMRIINTVRGRCSLPGEALGISEEDDTQRSKILSMLKESAYTPTELADSLDVSRQYVYKVLDSMEAKVYKLKIGKDVFYSTSKEMIEKLKSGKKKEGKIEKPISEEELQKFLETCLFCGRCESWCPRRIPHTTIYAEVLKEKFKKDKGKMRSGRGAIQDIEIREVGRPIVFGEIPGVIAPVGCPAYPKGGKELVEITKTFLDRNYIVTTSGCSAMTLGIDGKLYEDYSGAFDAACLVNVGSCVANSHIVGATVKIASIFAHRKIDANFEEISDYTLNRIGAVGIVWGTMSQKAFSIASGCNAFGIPVILGPFGKKYRRDLKSDEDTNWEVYDTKDPGKFDVGPVPEHLFYTAETKEEAIVLAAKLCMRANDTTKGRMIKLAHWIDFHEKFYGKLPDDFYKFVRTESDLPITRKKELLEVLKKEGWKPVEKVPDPTLVERLSAMKGGKKKEVKEN